MNGTAVSLTLLSKLGFTAEARALIQIMEQLDEDKRKHVMGVILGDEVAFEGDLPEDIRTHPIFKRMLARNLIKMP